MIILRNNENLTLIYSQVREIISFFAEDILKASNYELIASVLEEQNEKPESSKKEIEDRILKIFDNMFKNYCPIIIFRIVCELFPEGTNLKAVYLWSDLYYQRIHYFDKDNIKDMPLEVINNSIMKIFERIFKLDMAKFDLNEFSEAMSFVQTRIIEGFLETEVDITPVFLEESRFSKEETMKRIQELSEINDEEAEDYYNYMIGDSEYDLSLIEVDYSSGEEAVMDGEKINVNKVFNTILGLIDHYPENFCFEAQMKKINHREPEFKDDYPNETRRRLVLKNYKDELHNCKDLFKYYNHYSCVLDDGELSIYQKTLGIEYDLEKKKFIGKPEEDNDDGSMICMDDWEDDDWDIGLTEDERDEYMRSLYEETGYDFFARNFDLQKYSEIMELNDIEFKYQEYKMGLIETLAKSVDYEIPNIITELFSIINESEGFYGLEQIKPIKITPKKGRRNIVRSKKASNKKIISN